MALIPRNVQIDISMAPPVPRSHAATFLILHARCAGCGATAEDLDTFLTWLTVNRPSQHEAFWCCSWSCVTALAGTHHGDVSSDKPSENVACVTHNTVQTKPI